MEKSDIKPHIWSSFDNSHTKTKKPDQPTRQAESFKPLATHASTGSKNQQLFTPLTNILSPKKDETKMIIEHSYTPEQCTQMVESALEEQRKKHQLEIEQYKIAFNEALVYKTVESLAAHLGHIRQQQYAELYTYAITYSLTVAKQLLEKNPLEQPFINRLVQLACEHSPHNISELIIRVHPELLTMIEQAIHSPQMHSTFEQVKVSVRADHNIAVGAIDVEHNFGGASLNYQDLVSSLIQEAYTK